MSGELARIVKNQGSLKHANNAISFAVTIDQRCQRAIKQARWRPGPISAEQARMIAERFPATRLILQAYEETLAAFAAPFDQPMAEFMSATLLSVLARRPGD